MAAVGLIVHQGRGEAAEAARGLSKWLAESGHDVRVPSGEESVADGAQPAAADGFASGLDVVVTLGGDGSILRAVELTGEAGVPILGVNYGRMGYLTAVAPEEARWAIDRVLADEHDIEERLLLVVEFGPRDGPAAGRCVALNEAVVERPSASYALRLGVSVDGEPFTTYAADGLIVATPTGSTAYALSARGPVIDPAHRALLLTPVSPHMLFDRSLVVAADTRLRLDVRDDRGAVLSVDGRRIAELVEDDVVVCTASPHPARLVTFGARGFHQVLKTKFGLNDR